MKYIGKGHSYLFSKKGHSYILGSSLRSLLHRHIVEQSFQVQPVHNLECWEEEKKELFESQVQPRHVKHIVWIQKCSSFHKDTKLSILMFWRPGVRASTYYTNSNYSYWQSTKVTYFQGQFCMRLQLCQFPLQVII